MSRTLLSVIMLVWFLTLNGMLPEIDHCQWVEIMSNKDGVIIESDPDSSTILPSIDQSYFQLKPEERSPTDNSPRVLKKILGVNFVDLIIEKYPKDIESIIARMPVIYVVREERRPNFKKSWFNF